MRRSLIAGNWKMNLDRVSAVELVKTLVEGSRDVNDRDILICPSYPLLPVVKEFLNGSNIWLGAQNMHFEKKELLLEKFQWTCLDLWGVNG